MNEEVKKILDNIEFDGRLIIPDNKDKLVAQISHLIDQARQEMVGEIEKSSIFNTLSYHRRLEIWQELKRKWGILPINPVGCGGDS